MESSIVRGGTLQVLCLHRELYSILHTLVFHSIPSLSFYLFFFLLRSSPLSHIHLLSSLISFYAMTLESVLVEIKEPL